MKRPSPWLFQHIVPKQRWLFIAAVALVCASAATAGVWAAYQAAAPPAPAMSSMLPQGALLTIEAKDFAGLLQHWNDSPEKAAWLKSDNASVFSRSRLYGRLGDAQGEFAKAAGLPPDMSFLGEVAGSRSIFAWYDIGNLEFLYITQLPSGSAEKTRLVQMRSKFSQRQIGHQTFYVRTVPDPNSGSNGRPSPQSSLSQEEQPQEQGQDQSQGQGRTVAFATSGDWLLLSTREDLMTAALTLINQKAATAQSPIPLTQEPWFAEAQSAAVKDSCDLRMTLNLEKIARTPYFRSYWVQRNITEMKQYRSAVADLHIESGSFREERVLLPKSAPEDAGIKANLSALTALLPQHYGVYRAVAAPTLDDAVGSLNEKLLRRGTASYANLTLAPEADLTIQEAGGRSEFETRIDAIDPDTAIPAATPVNSHAPREDEFTPLRQALAAYGLEAMMTVSRTGPAADGIWVPFHSAIVLSAAKDWDTLALQKALQQAVQARLTASNLGLEWSPVKGKSGTYLEISGIRPLELAVQGHLCILADDPALITEILGHLGSNPGAKESPAPATLLAGFNPPEERASFARWTALLDRPSTTPGSEPAFFANNLRSLGDSFTALQSESLVARHDGPLIRQTVTYTWQH